MARNDYYKKEPWFEERIQIKQRALKFAKPARFRFEVVLTLMSAKRFLDVMKTYNMLEAGHPPGVILMYTTSVTRAEINWLKNTKKDLKPTFNRVLKERKKQELTQKTS